MCILGELSICVSAWPALCVQLKHMCSWLCVLSLVSAAGDMASAFVRSCDKTKGWKEKSGHAAIKARVCIHLIWMWFNQIISVTNRSFCVCYRPHYFLVIVIQVKICTVCPFLCWTTSSVHKQKTGFQKPFLKISSIQNNIWQAGKGTEQSAIFPFWYKSNCVFVQRANQVYSCKFGFITAFLSQITWKHLSQAPGLI